MNLKPFEGKTISRIDQHGDQVILYFTDDSMLKFTALGRGCGIGIREDAELEIQCIDRS